MIHDELNPYTAVQRSPSQWFVYVPTAEPLQDQDHHPLYHHPMTQVTLSHDAVNLNTIPPSASSVHSFESRSSPSDIDTRSAGNPYSHHPNFTTPSQYFGHLEGMEEPPRHLNKGIQKEETEDVLTVMDIQKLKDPFTNSHGFAEPMVNVNPPNDVTLNKNAFSTESVDDLRRLHVPFPTKGFPEFNDSIGPINPNATLNKKMFSPESMYELAQHEVHFEPKQDANLMVFREFSPQSLTDIRQLRNFSEYTDFQGRSSQDVATCHGISPSPSEVRRFEWTENIQYGGI